MPKQGFGAPTRTILEVGLALVLVLAFWWLSPRLGVGDPAFRAPADHHKYLFMAERPIGEFRIAPFCYRVLAPWLAERLGPMGFRILAAFSFGAMLLAFRALGERARPGLGLFAMVLAASAPSLGLAMLTNPISPDPLALALILLAALSAKRGWWLAAFVLAFVGGFVKESVVLAGPLCYAWIAGRTWNRKAALASLSLSLVALAPAIALRIWIRPGNDDPTYLATLPPLLSQVQLGTSEANLSKVVPWVLAWRFENLGMRQLLELLVFPWGGLALGLALVGTIAKPWYVGRFLPFVALVAAQAVVAVNNERLAVFAIPALICACLAAARDRTPRMRKGLVALAILGTLVTLASAALRQSPNGALIVLGLAAIALAWPDRRNRQPSGGSGELPDLRRV